TSAVIWPSTLPVSPRVSRWTWISPLTLPSTCSSPSAVRTPSRLMFSPMSEGATGAFRVGGGVVSAGMERLSVFIGTTCEVGLAGLLNIFSRPQKAIGVLGPAVQPDLIVQVNTGRASRRAHGAAPLAQRDALPRTDGDGREVRVAGLEPASMVDFDGVAVPGPHAG